MKKILLLLIFGFNIGISLVNTNLTITVLQNAYGQISVDKAVQPSIIQLTYKTNVSCLANETPPKVWTFKGIEAPVLCLSDYYTAFIITASDNGIVPSILEKPLPHKSIYGDYCTVIEKDGFWVETYQNKLGCPTLVILPPSNSTGQKPPVIPVGGGGDGQGGGIMEPTDYNPPDGESFGQEASSSNNSQTSGNNPPPNSSSNSTVNSGGNNSSGSGSNSTSSNGGTNNGSASGTSGAGSSGNTSGAGSGSSGSGSGNDGSDQNTGGGDNPESGDDEQTPPDNLPNAGEGTGSGGEGDSHGSDDEQLPPSNLPTIGDGSNTDDAAGSDANNNSSIQFEVDIKKYSQYLPKNAAPNEYSNATIVYKKNADGSYSSYIFFTGNGENGYITTNYILMNKTNVPLVPTDINIYDLILNGASYGLTPGGTPQPDLPPAVVDAAFKIGDAIDNTVRATLEKSLELINKIEKSAAYENSLSNIKWAGAGLAVLSLIGAFIALNTETNDKNMLGRYIDISVAGLLTGGAIANIAFPEFMAMLGPANEGLFYLGETFFALNIYLNSIGSSVGLWLADLLRGG